MLRQPRSVLAIAFATAIAMMGIGLVDPILKPIADELGASPSQVSLLFTSYMAIMGLAMLVTGAVSSRLGVKNTLLLGLIIIIIGAGMAGFQDGVAGIIAWRAVWGLGNALFIATALAAIVKSAHGSTSQAIILYEAAIGVGIAIGPIIGGLLGSLSWRGPFFGVSGLMIIAALVTIFLVPTIPTEGRPTTLGAPFKALAHGGLLVTALTALLYNFGFFTLLAYAPFPLDLSALQIGGIFFGWGLLLAISSVKLAPLVQGRFGTVKPITFTLAGFATILALMAIFTGHKAVLAICVIVAGAVIGLNNTLITETVMKAAPIERGVASAAYSFVRFAGGAVAPWLAGLLGERLNQHIPFWVGAACVLAAAILITSGRGLLRQVDVEEEHVIPVPDKAEEKNRLANSGWTLSGDER